MTQLVAIAKVVLPILICAALGIFARKKEILSEEHNVGIQRFVLKFCVPCVLFNSCLDAAVTSQTLLSMALLIPLLVVCFVVSLRLRKKALPYHSLPLLLTAHETGMLGIPLFIILFGVENAFHMGVLDIAQAFIAVPIITLVSADMGKGSVKEMLRGIFTSPILIMGVLGFVLGLSGAMAWLDSLGIGLVIREVTSFMAAPVSAAMLFCIGYNFVLTKDNRAAVMRTALVYLVMSAALCLVMQVVLGLVGEVNRLTRMAVLLYALLPGSYLAPGLGRSEADHRVLSGACSLLTLVTMVGFCVLAILTA